MSFWAPADKPPTELAKPRILSPTAGVKVSPLCLGAMSIGEAWAGGMGSMNKDQSFKLMDAFYEAGGNFIDTANNYQNEESETWIGAWMKARDNRDQMVIATKFTSNFKSYKFGKNMKSTNYSGNNRKSLQISVKASLEKLQTDYIDILYVHWWEWTTSVEELMVGLHALVQSGKVLYLGVSDTPAWVVAQANTYAKAHALTQFCVYQGRWNLMIRDIERDIIPMCREFGMAIAPWDVLGGGKFQTKKHIEERKQQGEGLRSMRPGSSADQTSEEEKMSAALEKVAEELECDSIQAVALSYVMQKTPYVFPIIGGRKVEYLQDNIKALSLHLSDKQIEYLEGILPFDIGFPMNFVGYPHATGKPGGVPAGQTANMVFQADGKPIGHA